MAQMIKRSIDKTIVKYQILDGSVKEAVLLGRVNPKAFINRIHRLDPENTITGVIIKDYKTEHKVYAMSQDTFIANAVEVEDKPDKSDKSDTLDMPDESDK